jgi:hypothetical protein
MRTNNVNDGSMPQNTTCKPRNVYVAMLILRAPDLCRYIYVYLVIPIARIEGANDD